MCLYFSTILFYELFQKNYMKRLCYSIAHNFIFITTNYEPKLEITKKLFGVLNKFSSMPLDDMCDGIVL